MVDRGLGELAEGGFGTRVLGSAGAGLAKAVDELEVTLEEIELAGHEHHMHKEIHEQPNSLQSALSGRLNLEAGDVKLGGLTSLERELPHVRRVLMTGYHGDKVWAMESKDVSPAIVRGDPSGLGLTEYRLQAGFLQKKPSSSHLHSIPAAAIFFLVYIFQQDAGLH